jgi:hypothetical protein
VQPRDAVRLLAFGRIALGASLLIAPRRVGALSIGPDADSGPVSVFSRALGARDALLGGMALHTVDTPQVAQRWVGACGAMDAIDFAAAMGASRLPASRRLLFGVLAGGSAVAHAALSRQVGTEVPATD